MDALMTERDARNGYVEAQDKIFAMTQERDALEVVIVEQCNVIASMQADQSEFKRLQEIEDDFQRLRDAVSDALLALTGTRRPTLQDFHNYPTEVWALAEELERIELD